MTAMTDGPVPSPLQAASLLLEAVPAPRASEALHGRIHETFVPRVPGTKRGMRFVGSIDLAATP